MLPAPIAGRRSRWRLAVAAALAIAAALFATLHLRADRSAATGTQAPAAWTAADIDLLRSLTLDALPARPDDPSNAFVGDPDAIDLGRTLFADTRLSAGAGVACASCHRPDQDFTDGRRVAKGVAEGARNTPTLIGAAHGRRFNWDGRIDTLWGQALGPIEAPDEMGSTRGEIARLLADDADLRGRYERVFGPLDPAMSARLPPGPCGPVAGAGAEAARATRCWQGLRDDQRAALTRVFVNVGKAIAAYEGMLRPSPGRFDRFVQALAAGDARAASAHLSAAEQRGLRLFITTGRTGCLNCHNGPMLTNGGFHDVGTNLGRQADTELGHMLGARLLETSEFRCDGVYSDALPSQCAVATFQTGDGSGDGRGAFKVPTLRGVARTAPYLHDGRLADLSAVLRHYSAPPLENVRGAHELKPLRLTSQEIDDLVSFLGTL